MPAPDPDVEILQETILQIQVCTRLAKDATLAWLHQNHPAGTMNGWALATPDQLAYGTNPCPCADHADRKHYVFTC